jgi:hypothetical protein
MAKARQGEERALAVPLSACAHMLRPRLKSISSPITMPASRMFNRRVAFAQVAQLVRHQALQFVAREFVERAAALRR